MHIWAEHLKTWLREAYLEKETTPPPKPLKFMKLVELVQFMWEQVTIPTDMGWKILILIP